MRIPILSAAMAIVALTACGSTEPAPVATAGPPLADNQTVNGNAVVRFVNVEGGCWALDTPAGRYQPTALPSAFRKDGLSVYVVVRRANVGSFCQIGPVVTIDTIRTP